MKWDAKELFEIFKNETNVDESKELYKAMLAREIGLDEYTEAADALMTELLETEYYNNPRIPAFIDDGLVKIVHNRFKEEEFEVDEFWW